ncbi:MAG: HalOD1 output domain-containing protein [Haloquadratum sp.]
MSERVNYSSHSRPGRTDTRWRTVAHHDFAGAEELDATIATVLGDDRSDEEPLYATVDTEPAERFLASVDGDDASVIFSIDDRTFRVSADGTVEVRTPERPAEQ